MPPQTPQKLDRDIQLPNESGTSDLYRERGVTYRGPTRVGKPTPMAKEPADPPAPTGAQVLKRSLQNGKMAMRRLGGSR